MAPLLVDLTPFPQTMKKLTLFLLLITLALPSFSQKKATIDQAYIERVIKTLAADQMMGRGNFTPGLTKAGEFIAQEFKQIGLKPLPGLTGYKQEFILYRVTPGNVSVRLNDKEVPSDQVLILSNEPTLRWQQGGEDSVAVVAISAADNFAQRVKELNKTSVPTLALVDSAHQAIFQRYKAYLSQGNITLTQTGDSTNQKKSNSAVFVLSEALAAPTFQVEASNTIDTLRLSNIAGMLPGKSKKDESVIFSAHYDHIGILPPVNGDSIANGADDDASGTAAVLALAKHFKKLNNNERTLIFVAFAAEEMGGFGSQYFSKQLDPAKVMAMFNIEMIGKPSKFGKNTAWITGFEKTDFGKILQKNLQNTPFTFHPDPYPQQDLFYRSDNATLARLGVPAHSISTDEIDIDKLYHSVDDEVETLNMANMTQVIKAIAASAQSIISGKDTPTRVDISELK